MCNEFCLVIFGVALVVVLGEVFLFCFVSFFKFKIIIGTNWIIRIKKSHMKTSRPLVIINIIMKRRFDNLPGSPVLSCIFYMQFICYLPKSNMLNTRHRFPPLSFNQFLSSCINVKLNNPIIVKSVKWQLTLEQC